MREAHRPTLSRVPFGFGCIRPKPGRREKIIKDVVVRFVFGFNCRTALVTTLMIPSRYSEDAWGSIGSVERTATQENKCVARGKISEQTVSSDVSRASPAFPSVVMDSSTLSAGGMRLGAGK